MQGQVGGTPTVEPPSPQYGALAVYWRHDDGVHMNWVAISDLMVGASRQDVMAEAYNVLMVTEAEVRQRVAEGGREPYPPDEVLKAASAEELLSISDEIADARKRVSMIHRPWLEQHALVISLPEMAQGDMRAFLSRINSLLLTGVGI